MISINLDLNLSFVVRISFMLSEGLHVLCLSKFHSFDVDSFDVV